MARRKREHNWDDERLECPDKCAQCENDLTEAEKEANIQRGTFVWPRCTSCMDQIEERIQQIAEMD